MEYFDQSLLIFISFWTISSIIVTLSFNINLNNYAIIYNVKSYLTLMWSLTLCRTGYLHGSSFAWRSTHTPVGNINCLKIKSSLFWFITKKILAQEFPKRILYMDNGSRHKEWDELTSVVLFIKIRGHPKSSL